MRAIRRLMPLFVLGILLLASSLASACPNCKNSLPDTEDGGLMVRLSNGYFWSYIAMSSMPFIAVLTIGVRLYGKVREAEIALNAESTPQ